MNKQASADGQTPQSSVFDNMSDPIEDIFSGKGDTAGFFLDENSGTLDISSFFGEEEGEQAAEDSTEEGDSNNLNVQEPEQAKQPVTAADARLASLEQNFEKLATILVAMANGKNIAGGQQQVAEPEPELDLSDSKSLAGFITKAVQDAVEQATGGLKQSNEEVKLHMSLARAQQRYGADFQAKLPAVAKLMQTDPNKWTFESAYEFIKTLTPSAPAKPDGSQQTKEVPKVQPQKVNIQKVIDKANSMKSDADSGMAPEQTRTAGRKISSIEGALDAALAQLSRK